MSANPVSSQVNNPWLVYPVPNPAARLRLICFHYAGGGAHAYRTWARKLPATIEVAAVQLPGRGMRLNEELLTSHEQLIPAVVEALTPALTKPFAFFGHSMGSIVAFEVTRLLRSRQKPLPVHLFVSGRGGPRQRDLNINLSELPDDELIAKLVSYDGAPRELLENADLMRLMLPTIRADFKVCESYKYLAQAPLDCPISTFGGLEDSEVKLEQLEAWRAETASAFVLRMLPGGHFYFQKAEHSILQEILRDLQRFL